MCLAAYMSFVNINSSPAKWRQYEERKIFTHNLPVLN
jgi:hypothetical protein